MPWTGEEPPFGFSDNPDTWLPMPLDWDECTVDAQEGDPHSFLATFQRAIELRHSRGEFGGGVEFVEMGPDVVAFRCADGLLCVLNTGTEPVPLPDCDVLIASGPTDDGLAPDAAAWLG
jgi:alpha-glucosidase